MLWWADEPGEEHAMAKILYVGTAGSDDPTRAGFPFNFALGALEAGHRPEIFLAGEAGYVMKEEIAAAFLPVGMTALPELLDKVLDHHVPLYLCVRVAC